MSDWSGDHWRDVLNVIALIVTTGGFALAYWQLRRLRTESELTQKVTQRTLDRLAANHLLVLLVQMQLLEQELERAVRSDDSVESARLLVRWRQGANQLGGMIGYAVADADSRRIRDKLDISVVIAASTRDAMRSGHKTLEQATGKVLEAVAEASNEISQLLAKLTMEVGSHD